MKQNTTTTWSWAHDGKNENGVVTFFANGTVSWNGGPKQGNWKLTNGNTVLQTTFNGIDHELTWKEAQEKAILDKPKRSPRSTMTLKPDLKQGTAIYVMFLNQMTGMLIFS